MSFMFHLLIIFGGLAAILNSLKGSGRALCSGGDVVALNQLINEGVWPFNILCIFFYISKL